MKGSDLVLEKSVFTEYVPTRVYRAHLKNIRFFRLMSLNSTILVVVPLHVGFRGALDHPMQAVSRENSPMHVEVHGNLVVIHAFVLINASVNITS